MTSRAPSAADSRGSLSQAFAFLADGEQEGRVVQRLVAAGVTQGEARLLVQRAASDLQADRSARARRDLVLCTVFTAIGGALSFGLSSAASGSGRIVVAVGLFLAAVGYGARGVSRLLGWRTEDDMRRGRELAVRHYSDTELDARQRQENSASRRRDRQMYMIVVLIVVFFVVVALAAT